MNEHFQLTLAILKPHILKYPQYLESIKQLIINSNFKIIQSKQECLSVIDAQNFYKEHKEKFFYNRLVTYMSSGPSIFYILGKINAIQAWRDLMGPTKVYKAQYSHPNSIRAMYGFSDTRNATHGSDSVESAVREINFFFPKFNIEQWIKDEEVYFKTNKLKFLKNEFIHIPIK